MKISDLSVVIASHEFATGPSQNLEEFCINKKTKKLLFLSHPLFYEEKPVDSWRYYEKGKMIKRQSKKIDFKINPLNYIKEIILNIFWVIRTDQKWDLYVGSDCLNAFSGIILKKLGKVKKTVYYCIDYVPERFQNKALNSIYHWIEIFCVKHSDVTWDLSPRMREAREKFHNLSFSYRSKQVLVPEGVWFGRIKRYPIEKTDLNSIIYSGQLAERLGVHKVIEAVPIIIKYLPNFKFIITGKGDYGKELEKLTKKLNVQKYIIFKGFIESHQELEKIIARCVVGVAPYSDEEKTFSYYCDPSKTKVYMGCGLPVIMTDVFYNAKDIEKAGAGKIISYDPKDIAKTLISIVDNKKTLAKYKTSAVEYIQKYDWNIILNSALNPLFRNEKN